MFCSYVAAKPLCLTCPEVLTKRRTSFYFDRMISTAIDRLYELAYAQ